MTQPRNVLLIMADEHSRKVLGCYGNSKVKTPNLDRLAAGGTLFTNAYTPSAICVPARAAFATGQYVHKTRHWSNATPYVGSEPSWGHVLQKAGYTVGSIGKLHYRNETDPTGLDFQTIPMHLLNGVGDVLGCVRDPMPKRVKNRNLAIKIGPGESGYITYDSDITTNTVDWLTKRGEENSETPFVLFSSLVCPHFPLIAPEEDYALYEGDHLMPEKPADGDSEHPWMKANREAACYDNFTPETTSIALRSYYALVSFVDRNVGQILDALDAAGLGETTQIVYVSDHGDNAGERELWGKSNLFEEASGIPAIISGPDIPKGRVCDTPVSLLDIFPTVLDATGLEAGDGIDRPGRSMSAIANAADDPERTMFSEYHAAQAATGAFMLRKGPWKLMHYVNMPQALYNLDDDPEELHDVAGRAANKQILDELTEHLFAICDPVAVDQNCRKDHDAIIEQHGGRDAVVKKGGFGGTPAPGEKAEFSSSA